jgi:hypothetical protein
MITETDMVTEMITDIEYRHRHISKICSQAGSLGQVLTGRLSDRLSDRLSGRLSLLCLRAGPHGLALGQALSGRLSLVGSLW